MPATITTFRFEIYAARAGAKIIAELETLMKMDFEGFAACRGSMMYLDFVSFTLAVENYSNMKIYRFAMHAELSFAL
jgi:hypothetical protein